MSRKWKTVKSEELMDCFIFKVHKKTRKSPITLKEHSFYTLEANDWVNVIVLTKDNQVLLVEQYRHGTDSVTLEIPAGHVDLSDKNIEDAMLRELQEETGFIAEKIDLLGSVCANPAFMNNSCTTFLVRDARKESDQSLEETEDISFRLVDLASIPEMILSGEICHSLTVAAFYLYEKSKK